MRLAIIPARGGSKRIPRKNVVELLGKPMIAWTIEAVRASGVFDAIHVSTDDAEIAEISKENGAEVPFFRPSEFATDTAPFRDVIKNHVDVFHAIQSEKVNFVGAFLATAVLLDAHVINSALSYMQTKSARSLVAVKRYPYPIQRAFSLSEQSIIQGYDPATQNLRTQDAATFFHDAGQFYFGDISEHNWLGDPFLQNGSLAFELEEMGTQDIDTREDLILAELKLSARLKLNASF